jgi:hypothetical protein
MKKLFFTLQTTYYIAPQTHGPIHVIAKGKLVDRYRNKKRKLLELGLIPVTKESKLQDVHNIQQGEKFIQTGPKMTSIN